MLFEVGKASANLTDFEHPDLPVEVNTRLKLLTHLFVSAEHRQQGHATALLNQLAQEADEAQIAILLQPGIYDGEMQDKDLIKFYEKHGYATLQDEPHLMVRFPKHVNLQPKQSTIAILDVYGNSLN